jgi:ribokinase
VAHAEDPFAEPAGGGAVAAVQLARLAGEALLITALGRDQLAISSLARLRALGVRVQSSSRPRPTRHAVTLLDGHGERTIVTFGPRLDPAGEDAELPWGRLAAADGVYFTAGDLAALQRARETGVLVASPRARHALGHGVRLDALVLSADDAIERQAAEDALQDADLVVYTEGERGGTFTTNAGEQGSYHAASPPGPAVDSYGCGDSFAAGLTYGLAAGMGREEALALGARCGAVCVTGRGPYERQLTFINE